MSSSWRNLLILETTIAGLICFGPVSTLMSAGQWGKIGNNFVFCQTLILEQGELSTLCQLEMRSLTVSQQTDLLITYFRS